MKLDSKSVIDKPSVIFMTVDNTNNKSSNKQEGLAKVEKRIVYKASNHTISQNNVKPTVHNRGISSSVRPEIENVLNDDLETEMLKQEYLKLKRTLNKLKTESNTNPSKNIADQRPRKTGANSSIAAPILEIFRP